eukprot:TRINITY_DN457_c0_g1_i1.p1 TRINITY_DN457_c0_g1~~TRINITY_DN457_c0_g1_i1.p1  ORF type:complete len:233 (-),score=61.32 TRINITY_DN457_c0_g1_i1:132-830(-)
MTQAPRSSKMLQYLNWRMKVTISDTRTLVGTYLAFDRHMNMVLADTEEYRKIKTKKGEEKEEKRALGLVLLRGEHVISLQADAPPPPKPRSQQLQGKGGPGKSQATGRGISTATPLSLSTGLNVPLRGLGGPSPSMMMPVSRTAVTSAQPIQYTPQSTSSTTTQQQQSVMQQPPQPMMGRGFPMQQMPFGRGMQLPPPPQMMFGRGLPMNPQMMLGRGMMMPPQQQQQPRSQ